MDPIFDAKRPVKHVSRKAIYTRLEARINYLKDFLGFGTGMHSHLTEFAASF